MWNLKKKKKVKFIETKSRKVIARAGGQGNKERLVKGYKLLAIRLTRSEDLMYYMVTLPITLYCVIEIC